MTGADDLMKLHVEALYVLNDGRIAGINQWDGGPVPRLHVGATATGARAWYREDLPAGLVADLAALVATEPGGRPVRLPDYAALLSAGDTAHREGPALALPDSVMPPTPAGTVAVSADNAAVLRNYLGDWLPDAGHREPFMVALDGPHAVAVCASARETNAACEAAVATAEPFRRAGFAARAVAAWALAVRASGRTVLYSTTWDNRASRALAGSLGFEVFGADLQIF